MIATATTDVVNWIATLLNVESVAVEQTLWYALIVGLAFASIHLVTMFVTRWGDGDATSKSLIFSVLVHISCLFGAVTLKVTEETRADVSRKEEQPPTQVHLFVDAEERRVLKDKGNTPVWDELTRPMDRELARMNATPRELRPVEGPERRPEELTPPDVDVPDLPQVPDEPIQRPELDERGERGPQSVAMVAREVDSVESEMRPDARTPSAAFERRSVVKNGLQEDAPPERDPRRGAVDRVAEAFTPSRTLPEMLERPDASAFLKRGEKSDVVRRRSGPAAPLVASEETGSDTPRAGTGSVGSASERPRFSRIRTRNPLGKPGGVESPVIPDRTPRTLQPVPGEVVAVRRGVPSPLPTEGLRANVVRPNFEPARVGKRAIVPPTYRLRLLARDKDIARKFGGTDSSERAVEVSLRWLALHQNLEGYWDPDGFSLHCPRGDQCTGPSGRALHGAEDRSVAERRAGLHANSGVTALALLAFMGKGYTHEEGRYADQVDRGLSWLIRQQDANGYLGGNATRYARMYCHGMATYALAEAYGLQRDPSAGRRLRAPLERALAYTIAQQNPADGGWRYVRGQQSDTSMFGWQLMALKSAEIAGIAIPSKTRQGMFNFLSSRSLGKHGGLAAYRILKSPKPPYKLLTKDAVPTATMTAEALFCKQMLGVDRNTEAGREAVEFLLGRLPRLSDQNLYYWYYGTLSMYQHGGEPWRQWNERVREILVAEQRKTGHVAGSWDPKGPWGPHGGRVYSTAMATLCLQTYYRIMPRHQMSNR
uniref:Membrane protein n=1 Tax=uncultured planctomycete 3FN TaxID=455066 RepID=A9LGW7_9BACT|nr:membrane protein [uncultured planctomycete 3FN]